MGRPRIHILIDDNSLTPTVLDALRFVPADVSVASFERPQATVAYAPGRRDGAGGADQTRSSRHSHRTYVDDQFRLAASLQRNLQAPAPTTRGVDVHTLHLPADIISGDAYDVVRLDETHIALTVADATGHGLPAGLLSTFVRRSLRGKELTRDGYRLLDPDEVLARANTDILETRLQECQFVTALYAVYDEATRVIRWARGGAPYPILVRPGVPPTQLTSRGPLLGAIPHARFEVMQRRLDPGDTVLLHTDGLDALVLGGRPDLGCCHLDRTAWFTGLGQGAIGAHLRQIEAQRATIGDSAWKRDDITVVALHVCVAQPPRLCFKPNSPLRRSLDGHETHVLGRKNPAEGGRATLFQQAAETS